MLEPRSPSRYACCFQAAATGTGGLALPVLGLATWGATLVAACRTTAEDQPSPLLLLGSIAIPIEFGFTALAGQGLTHYYINWLPILSLLSGIFCHRHLQIEETGSLSTRPRKYLGPALLAAALLLPARRVLPNAVHVLTAGPRDTSRTAAEVTAYNGTYLLMWGAEVSYNYIAGLPAPTKYAYQYPLYTCDYVSGDMLATFRRDIETWQPVIVDTSSTNDRVPPIDPNLRGQRPQLEEECALSPAMRDLLEWLQRSYTYAGSLPSTGWAVYRPIEWTPTDGQGTSCGHCIELSGGMNQ
ncbi:MAG: hypothetical protein A2Z17_07110 [Gammaproteobacteria bacterium RBG_16_66_13]|nr:MAG: hypothetical protein A2Z17_07110 [Gammaproteobacteria bacterium RBG_16_66_13]